MTTAAICATRELSWRPSFYRGEQYDSDLGLYYLRARYYNPATGRFLSRDPLDGNAVDPASLHKYLYAGGDPVNMVDPTGRGDVPEFALLEERTLPELEEGIYTAAKFVAKYYTCIGFVVADIAFMAGKSNWESNTAMAILWARCLASF